MTIHPGGWAASKRFTCCQINQIQNKTKSHRLQKCACIPLLKDQPLGVLNVKIYNNQLAAPLAATSVIVQVTVQYLPLSAQLSRNNQRANSSSTHRYQYITMTRFNPNSSILRFVLAVAFLVDCFKVAGALFTRVLRPLGDFKASTLNPFNTSTSKDSVSDSQLKHRGWDISRTRGGSRKAWRDGLLPM